MYQGQNRIFGPPGSANNFRQLYQNGSGINSNHLQLYQNGAGFGSFLGSMFRRVVPIAKRAARKLASSDLVKKGISSAGDVATNVVSDIIEGDVDISDSLKNNIGIARKEIAKSLRKTKKRKLKTFPKVENKVKRKKVKYSLFKNE